MQTAANISNSPLFVDDSPSRTMTEIGLSTALLRRRLDVYGNAAMTELTFDPETLRATVLGASTQTVTLSGSTIWAEQEISEPEQGIQGMRFDSTGAPLTLPEKSASRSRRWSCSAAWPPRRPSPSCAVP